MLRSDGPRTVQGVPSTSGSSEPITAILKPLMQERGLTYRALASLTRDEDPESRGVTYAYLCGLASGREYPSRRALELVAACLELPPSHFAEYRLAELQGQLDARRVGFEAAWRRYSQLTG